jgi:hypothetical protein
MEQAGGKIVAIECKWKEHPGMEDAAGLRALAEAEKGRVGDRYLLCRSAAAYRLADGTWVTNIADLLDRLL